MTAREATANAQNLAGGGRQVPRIYKETSNYERKLDLGISTRDETAQKDKAVLDSVMGQLSDGMWENSRAMEKYWHSVEFGQNESGGVELRFDGSYRERIPKTVKVGGKWTTINQYNHKWSGYGGMDSAAARDFFAKKIKQVFNEERKSDPSIGKWSADNNTKMEFMHNGVTVADAYSLWKRLKR